MRLAFLSLWLAATAVGQNLFDPNLVLTIPSTPSTLNPTNLGGNFNATTWLVAADYKSNSTVNSYLLDRIGPIHMTNNLVQSSWPVGEPTSGPNSSFALKWNGTSTRLFAATYSIAQPIEVDLLVKFPDQSGAVAFFSVGPADGHSDSYNNSAPPGISYGGADNLQDCGNLTNRWFLMSTVFQGANSGAYSNAVKGTTVSSSITIDQFALGYGIKFANGFIDMEVVECAIFTNALPSTNVTARSNLNYYYTNTYKFTQ